MNSKEPHDHDSKAKAAGESWFSNQLLSDLFGASDAYFLRLITDAVGERRESERPQGNVLRGVRTAWGWEVDTDRNSDGE